MLWSLHNYGKKLTCSRLKLIPTLNFTIPTLRHQRTGYTCTKWLMSTPTKQNATMCRFQQCPGLLILPYMTFNRVQKVAPTHSCPKVARSHCTRSTRRWSPAAEAFFAAQGNPQRMIATLCISGVSARTNFHLASWERYRTLHKRTLDVASHVVVELAHELKVTRAATQQLQKLFLLPPA